MKIKTSFYITLAFGMMGNSIFAQSQTELAQEISRVESGLMPVIRFEGKPLWTLESRMKHYNIPGVSIAVIKNSKIIWSRTYGLADVEAKTPVSLKTLFQAASMSKPVSAYAALKEVEAGKINPDADVNLYLTSWKVPETQFTKEKKVSLKNIVSHTAGFTVHGFGGYEPGKPIPTLIQVLNGQNPANSPAVIVDKLPGTPFRYAGGGYCVMQQMLIDVTGKDFPTVMKENVLLPLDMKNSTFSQPLPENQAQWAATAYTMDGQRVNGRYHIYPEMAAAGLWTTAEDLARFVIDIQNTLNNKSHTVISKKTAEEFTSPFIDKFEGLGIFLENKSGQIYFNHGGWNEGFSSKFIGNKTSGDGIVILTNTNKPDFIEELVRSVASVYHWPNYLAPVYKTLSLKEQDFSRTIGRYRFDKYGLYRIYRENGKLLLNINDLETPMELIKVGENKYVMQNWDFTLEFVKDPTTGKLELVQVLQDKTIRSKSPQMSSDEKTPLEFVMDGDFEKGLQAFQKAKSETPDHYFLSEDYLNNVGYALLGKKDFTKAIGIFRVNSILYPDHANVYDSLGEAYLKAGQKDKAKQTYQKLLEINPDNEVAIKALKTL
nr:serine hydrolase [uncultured Chryseobacterium sp.]